MGLGPEASERCSASDVDGLLSRRKTQEEVKSAEGCDGVSLSAALTCCGRNKLSLARQARHMPHMRETIMRHRGLGPEQLCHVGSPRRTVLRPAVQETDREGPAVSRETPQAASQNIVLFISVPPHKG